MTDRDERVRSQSRRQLVLKIGSGIKGEDEGEGEGGVY